MKSFEDGGGGKSENNSKLDIFKIANNWQV